MTNETKANIGVFSILGIVSLILLIACFYFSPERELTNYIKNNYHAVKIEGLPQVHKYGDLVDDTTSSVKTFDLDLLYNNDAANLFKNLKIIKIYDVYGNKNPSAARLIIHCSNEFNNTGLRYRDIVELEIHSHDSVVISGTKYNGKLAKVPPEFVSNLRLLLNSLHCQGE